MSVHNHDRRGNKQPQKRSHKGRQAHRDDVDDRQQATATELPGNGQAKRKRAGKQPVKPPPTIVPAAELSEAETDGEDLEAGVRTPKKADMEKVRWFDPPDIALGILTLLTAPPSAGKSTYLTYLAAKAKRPAIFHGDDDYNKTVVGRLVASSVPLKTVKCIEPGDRWQFPRDLGKLKRFIQKYGIDLVTIDPIDEYCEDNFDEDKSRPVRRLLFGLIEIAKECGVAIVIVRHPGKDPTNLLPGSKTWRSVPRMILRLVPYEDRKHCGIFHHYKNHIAESPDDRDYCLQGPEGKHKRFAFGEKSDPFAAKQLMEVPDRIERSKIAEARSMVRGVLADSQWHDGKQLYAKGKELQISDPTVRRALEAEMTEKRTKGQGADFTCEYRLPRSCSVKS